MSRRKRKKKRNNFLRILMIIITIFYGLYLNKLDSTYSLNEVDDVFKSVSGNLEISYLDVGQADSILIRNNDETMLIDAGNNEDGKNLVKYFKEKGITKFKYLVGTHPHEDHIGGLDDVINNFDIGTIYMPDAITTTKTFMDVLDAIELKKMTYKVPKIQEVFTLGDAIIEVLYTGNDTNDLNNTSIVLRLDFGNTNFLFTGDATSKSEKEMLKSGVNLKSDVLKVGHHGSRYSTSKEFLETINPKYAIISVGDGNSYNHPEDEIIKRLNNYNIDTYRTDLSGTIVITSDGNNINVNSINTNLDG